MSVLRSLARTNTRYKANLTVDAGIHQEPVWMVFQILNEEGHYVDPPRIMTHPSFVQEEGQGIYTYPYNPDDTFNFALAPTRKVDSVVHKTISSSIVVQQPEVEEDVVITEVWRGGQGRASTLAEMFRTLYDYWITIPEPGEYCTWAPADLSVDTFDIILLDVSLGDTQDIKYRELRVAQSTRDGAYLTETLTVRFKIAKPIGSPQSVITLSGI